MNTEKNKSLLSILTPFYNEEECIDEYFKKLIPILEKTDMDYEIICVDDGSLDKTFDMLCKFHKKNNKIKVFKLSRNFGKEIALTCCLDKAKGNAVIPLDADLQDPPDLIFSMIKKWREGFKVVLMQRRTRDESFLKKITAKMFYKIMNKISDSEVYPSVGDFRLMDEKVLKSIKKLKEKNRFMKGILSWVGYRHCIILYDRPKRNQGENKQNYRKLVSLALNGIFSFSSTPLKISTYIGFVISFFSFIYGIIIIGQKIFYQTSLPGYASMMVVILFLGGIQLLSIGILGEYIARIFNEVKNRPIYIIEESQE